MATVAVDPTIPNSAIGAPYAADCWVALRNFLATVNDGDTIQFPVNRVYLAQKAWKFVQRNNLTINGRGSHLVATVKSPFSDAVNGTGTVAGCTVGLPRWDYGGPSGTTILTVTAPAGTHPFGALTAAGVPPSIKPNIFAWYVSTNALPGNNARTQDFKDMSTAHLANVPATTDNVTHILMPRQSAWPLGTYTLKFVSPEDHDRVNVYIEKCTNMVFQNMTVRGANQANGTFDTTFEGQHNFRVLGGNGVEIGNCIAYDAWADSVGIYFDLSYVAAKNVWVHDCQLYNGGRHGITINGLDGGIIENCDIHDVNRHAIDVEINGNMQKAKNVTIQNNRFGNAGIGIIAISTGYGTPADISDFLIDSNVCYGSSSTSTFQLPIGTQQNTVVAGTGGRLAGDISRWENFTVTNNVSSPNVQSGTGGLPPGWISGHAYAVGAQVYDAGQPYTCKVAVTSANRPGDDPTHWRQLAIFNSAPAEIKVQYCDNVTIRNNVVNMATGRLMWAVWTENCTGVSVSGNHDHTATDAFVNPHFEWHTDVYSGNGTFKGGGTFTGTGHSAVGTGTQGNGSFHGGGTFTGVGRGVNRGTGTFRGGGDFAGTGRGVNHGSGTFHGGGTFTAKGRGHNTGSGTFKGGGKFIGVGRGRNHGSGTFKGGGTFSGAGVGLLPSGSGTFKGGGTFTGVGLSRNFGRGTFKGGGTFTGRGRTDPTGGSFKDGDWLVGGVKMRGPGWDDQPWDTGPWDGEE